MLTGHRSAWRRRPRGRAARLAIPLAIPMALGLTLGVVLAFSSGAPRTTIQQADAGATATPTASASGPASAVASPSASAPAAPANVSCDIIVPANPLSAKGLATPYQLTGPDGQSPQASGCAMTNAANLGAFVQATILDPATGKLSVYQPLVITRGTVPAAAPVVPALPRHAVVTIDFGFNGTNLTQVGATPWALWQGRCTGGLGGSIFGQVSFCNGTQFFQAAFRAERQGRLKVPAAGTATRTGQPCLTVRSFAVVDQDQSDNVTSTYLLTASGQTAQNNRANAAQLAGAQVLSNGSDNALLDGFLDPVIGCTPFQAPDLSNGGALGTSQGLDELAAARNQAAPVALVPENDEMVLRNNAFNAAKTNLYRAEVGQDPISFVNNRVDSPAMYCQNMLNIQAGFLARNQNLLATGTSPVPAVGNNLFTFMANRLSMSFANLDCQKFGLTDPVKVTLDGTGAATAATINTTQQKATSTGATGMPAPGHRWWNHGRSHHRLMDPSGM